MKVTVKYTNPIPAPIQAGAELARLVIEAPGEETLEVPLIAGGDVKRLGLFGRLGTAFKYILWGSSG